MNWQTRVVLIFSVLFGVNIYSAFGLLYFNMMRVRHGAFPLILLIPLLMVLGTLWIVRFVLARRNEPLFVTPFLGAVAIFSVVPGMVMAFFVWGAVGSFCLTREWDKAKAEGYAFEAPAHQPVDLTENNAVVWLQRAQATIKLDPKGHDSGILTEFIRQAATGSVSPGQLREVKGILLNNQKALEELDRAANCPRVNWDPMDYEFNGQMPSFNYLNAGRLEACRSIVAAQKGRYEEATQAIGNGFWLARAVSLPKSMIGSVVGMVLNHLALDAAQFRFQKLPEGDLDRIWAAQVKPEEVTRTWKEGLSMELVLSKKMFAAEGPKMYGPKTFDAICYFVTGPFVQLDMASGLHWGARLRACFDLPFPRIEPSYREVDEWFHKNGWTLSQVAEPRFVQMYGKALDCETCLRLSRLALASRKFFEKNHSWPVSVGTLEEFGAQKADLIDPFNGKAIQLVRSGDSLLIYSIGPDLVDDKGMKVFDRNQSSKGGDLVFRLSPPTRKSRGPRT